MHDHRRSNIPVEISSAFAAVPSLDKRFGFNRSALRAGLRSATRIDFNQFDTSVFSFVSKVVDDLSPRGVVNVLGMHPASQAFDVELFNSDPTEAINQISSYFVAEITTAISDPSVIFSNGGYTLAPSLGPSFASSDCALSPSHALRSAPCPIRALYGFAVAQCNEAGQPEIDANRLRPCALNRVHFNMEDHIPFTCVPGQGRALRLGRKFAMPLDLYLTWYTDNSNSPALLSRDAVSETEISSMIPATGLESRKPGFLAGPSAPKKRHERFIQLTKYLLLSGARPSTDAFWIVTTDNRQRNDLLVAGNGSPVAPRQNSMFKRGIIEAAKISQHFRKCGLLIALRIDSKFIGEYHRFGSVLLHSGPIKSASSGASPSARSRFVSHRNSNSKRRAFVQA